jgi:hypothetical protein
MSEEITCDACTSKEDVRTVQMRKEGMAAEFVPLKTRLCRKCREKKSGKWRYWR